MESGAGAAGLDTVNATAHQLKLFTPWPRNLLKSPQCTLSGGFPWRILSMTK